MKCGCSLYSAEVSGFGQTLPHLHTSDNGSSLYSQGPLASNPSLLLASFAVEEKEILL